MRKSLVALSLVLTLPLGCATTQPRPTVRTSAIEPLSEPEFDQFANQLAEAIAELLKQRHDRLPAVITAPRVEPAGVEDSAVARAFARRLAEGLSDRLSGAALFTKSGITPAQLGCTLGFREEEAHPGRRRIIFRVLDEKSGDELLVQTCAYKPLPLPPPPAPPAVQPLKGELEIDAPSREIAEMALRYAPLYRARTIAGNLGRVIFLDSKTWKRLWLQSQRATRTADNRLRVELDIRSRRKERDAELRVIFYDDQDIPVDLTPVIPYRFLPHYTKQVTITSASPRATRYICLIEYD